MVVRVEVTDPFELMKRDFFEMFGEFQLVLGERRIRWGNLQDEIGVLELWMGLVGLVRL